MKPVYEPERRSTKRWLLISVAIVATMTFVVAAVVLPVAALRAQAATARRAWVVENRLAKLQNQLAQGQKAPDVNDAPFNTQAPTKPAVQWAGTKWEYKVVGSASVGRLDAAGAEGWELVAVSGTTAYFKRPQPSAKPEKELLPPGS